MSKNSAQLPTPQLLDGYYTQDQQGLYPAQIVIRSNPFSSFCYYYKATRFFALAQTSTQSLELFAYCWKYTLSLPIIKNYHAQWIAWHDNNLEDSLFIILDHKTLYASCQHGDTSLALYQLPKKDTHLSLSLDETKATYLTGKPDWEEFIAHQSTRLTPEKENQHLITHQVKSSLLPEHVTIAFVTTGKTDGAADTSFRHSFVRRYFFLAQYGFQTLNALQEAFKQLELSCYPHFFEPNRRECLTEKMIIIIDNDAIAR